MKLGLMLPHFGPGASYERLFELAPRLAGFGINSVWARDQMGFRGGLPWEKPGTFFLDPVVALATVAARSDDLLIGTATLTPIRPPLLTAQVVGALSFASRGRYVLGIGLGGIPRLYSLAGIPWEERHDRFRETIEVIRALQHPDASYHGRYASFEHLTLDPAPPEDLEIWFSGTSPGAIRLTVEYATGWFPGRLPLPVFDRLLERLDASGHELGRRFKVGLMPLVSIDRDRDTALAKLNVEGILTEARGKASWRWMGEFRRAEDLRGIVIAGTVDDAVDDLRALEERGVDQVVLDLRQRPDDLEELLRLIGAEVAPAVAEDR
ncbi:MAG TPA: LLM class flavin-dependent oxidoreductase [Candidatus Limnocylindrales bacterium]|nr:LLM class flavin-dependent oxidoreductase [Candidatus Limnocylindrales bacterium]